MHFAATDELARKEARDSAARADSEVAVDI